MKKTLIFGTANFGQAYGGVRNITGLPRDVLIDIFRRLEDVESIGLDTSPEYGNSEKIIGEFLNQRNYMATIISKIPKRFYEDANLILESAKRSLSDLGVASIDSFLLHGFDSNLLNNSKSISDGLRLILDSGLSKKVGISCYTNDEVILAKKALPVLTKFQIPECLVDQSKLNAVEIQEMFEEGQEFIIRSIFLQGNLLKKKDSLPDYLSGLKSSIDNVSSLARSVNLEPIEICMAYAKSVKWASSILVGLDSISHLDQITEAFDRNYDEINFDIQTAEGHLIDPRRWKE